jgi:hypothetical protein
MAGANDDYIVLLGESHPTPFYGFAGIAICK